jgi:hypothetical protein
MCVGRLSGTIHKIRLSRFVDLCFRRNSDCPSRRVARGHELMACSFFWGMYSFMYSVDLRDANERRKILTSPIKAWIEYVHDPLKEIYILLFGLKLVSHDSLFRRSSLGSSRGPKLGTKCRCPLTESWNGNEVAALGYQTAGTTWRAPQLCGSRLCSYVTGH